MDGSLLGIVVLWDEIGIRPVEGIVDFYLFSAHQNWRIIEADDT